MLTDAQREFLTSNHNGALTTFRRNGAAQMSIVTCGIYGDGVAFTTTEDRAKLRNLRRDPALHHPGGHRRLAQLRGAGGRGPAGGR